MFPPGDVGFDTSVNIFGDIFLLFPRLEKIGSSPSQYTSSFCELKTDSKVDIKTCASQVGKGFYSASV